MAKTITLRVPLSDDDIAALAAMSESDRADFLSAKIGAAIAPSAQAAAGNTAVMAKLSPGEQATIAATMTATAKPSLGAMTPAAGKAGGA